ncbi:hypothetical protein GCM10022245_47670 [Streptomyces mayteni]
MARPAPVARGWRGLVAGAAGPVAPAFAGERETSGGLGGSAAAAPSVAAGTSAKRANVGEMR